jgi:gluconate 2-dehydrogenase gamma chain
MSSVERPASSRRIFLKQVAGASGALSVGRPLAMLPAGVALGAASADAAAQPALPAVAVPAGYASLSPDEAAFVEAMVNVMCPADGLTPNGVDCGLATYIDRQLAGPFGKGQGRYMRGPWKAGKPQLGLQLPLTPEQFFKAGVAAVSDACARKYGKSFGQLASGEADDFLKDIQGGKVTDARVPLASWFNDVVYPLFVQACFADPMYGGNHNKVFWKMIGYPGLPATHTLDMVQYRGKPYPGAASPKSIADFS